MATNYTYPERIKQATTAVAGAAAAQADIDASRNLYHISTTSGDEDERTLVVSCRER